MLIKKNDNVLDLCCGDGSYSYLFFSDISNRVDAIDYDEDSISYAKKRYKRDNINFICENLLTYEITNNFYDVVIINAGKQYEGKKIDFIIKVVKELVNKFTRKDIVLILIGNASKEYDKIIQNESQSILEHIIRILFLENQLLKDYYSLADIGILPGVPSNTIQEAMACEVSVILPNNNTISHLIDTNGFFIQEFDVEIVANSINTLIKNNLLEEYKYKSRNVVSRYSWKEIAKESLYI